MRISIRYALKRIDLDVEPGNNLGCHTGPDAQAEPGKAIREALERPFRFPPLRRALTPDDHVVLLLDERLPRLGELVTVILEHITSASVEPGNITLLCPPPRSSHSWIDDLPDEFGDVHVEDHDPKNRQKLAYLATTRAGRRLYLNRSLVDADQVVLLTERRYDPLLGIAGAEGAIFPDLSDEQTRDSLASEVNTDIPEQSPGPLRQEAIEVSWLLGQPFHVQVIGSAGAGVSQVIAGASDSARESERLLEKCWRVQVPRLADTVVVSLSGDPGQHTFADLARAVTCAVRVVKPLGRIIVLSEVTGDPGPGTEVLLRSDDAASALTVLQKGIQPGWGAALEWARAMCHARVSLLSKMVPQTVEDLFATPLEDLDQVQRLIAQGQECLFLEDGQRMLAVVAE